MHTKTELITLLKAHRLRLSKRLGQHYLIDARLTRRAIDSCELRPDDVVLEIGAGLGALTGGLAERAKQVIAVEFDRRIAGLLAQRLAPAGNVTVLHDDILRLRWEDYPATVVIGAIPYQVTSEVIARLCQQAAAKLAHENARAKQGGLRGAWLGVQAEVARRLCARPGTKEYGRLTILGRHRFEVTALFRMPRQAFFPVPNIESTWIRLQPLPPRAVDARDEQLAFELVRAAFAHRRKTLANCLLSADGGRLSTEAIAEAMSATGLPSNVRGERLSFDQFLSLARHLHHSIHSILGTRS